MAREVGLVTDNPYATPQAKETRQALEVLAEALRAKGLTVHTGWQWDGHCGYKGEFWYFFPHDNRDAGVYHEIPVLEDSHQYDAGDIIMEGVLERVTSLPSNPESDAVWSALAPQ